MSLLLPAIRIAFEALVRNKERSLLTVLGVIIGVAAVIITVAIGAGARAAVDRQIASLGSNVIIVVPGSLQSQGARTGLGGAATLNVADGLAVANLPHVTSASPMVNMRAQVVSDFANWQTSVAGAAPTYLFIRNWMLESGSFFNDTDVATSAKVCVVGATVARNLFPSNDPPLGQTVRIRNVPFQVVGVLKRRGQNAMGMDQDDTIVVPYTAVMQRLSANVVSSSAVNALIVSADAPGNITSVLGEITALLQQRHRIIPPAPNDFDVRNLADIASAAATAATVLQILLASIAAVSLVVGGIGIMNIMLVSVTERTREIGLRMAVGARGGAILTQFLIEATVLSLLGGAVGVMLGLAGAGAASAIGKFPYIISLPTLAGALAFSAAIGVFFGYYPALKAARLDPIVALHAE